MHVSLEPIVSERIRVYFHLFVSAVIGTLRDYLEMLITIAPKGLEYSTKNKRMNAVVTSSRTHLPTSPDNEKYLNVKYVRKYL